MPAVAEWQSRPLEAIYPIVFLDGIVFKVRKDSRVINKCVYSVLGINMDGRKEILGIWISENESASFWTTVCNELKNRGVQDILIACRDNLSGFSTAIETVFPKTEQQLCVIHQIRNSTKYVPYKDIKAVMADLKKVYGAPTLDDAEYRLEEFREKWGKKYPQILKSWTRIGRSFRLILSTRRRFGPSSTPPTQSRDFIACCENTPRQRPFILLMMLLKNQFICRLWKSQKNGACLSEIGES